MIEIILIIVLALLSSWEELQQLVQRGSWRKDMFYPFLFWETKWNSKWKLFDSHHIAFGLFILVMCIILRIDSYSPCDSITWLTRGNFNLPPFLKISIDVILTWWFFFYIRNLGLHIIFRRSYYRQWKYISPIQF
jgi:hypothetical protein